MELVTNKARAYVNFGRWIADCPTDCGSALQLQAQQGMFHCVECGHIAPVEWPEDADPITEELAKRPAPRNRNWFPKGHDLALRAGLPHGQSVKELQDETVEHTS